MTTEHEHPGVHPPKGSLLTPVQLAERRLAAAEERHWLTLSALKDPEADLVSAQTALVEAMSR